MMQNTISSNLKIIIYIFCLCSFKGGGFIFYRGKNEEKNTTQIRFSFAFYCRIQIKIKFLCLYIISSISQLPEWPHPWSVFPPL